MWNRKVGIRIVEVLLCIACVVALRVTDDESRRVFHYLRNRSREWSLLNNVTWGTIGAALATATCGGYVIITAGLLIAAATGELRGRKTELFFLGLGVVLFGIVGALSLASIESVPEDLIDNAAVLGALCLVTALVFIADLLMTQPRKKPESGVQPYIVKDKGKRAATLTTEKETKSTSTGTVPETGDPGKVNSGFDKMVDRRTEDGDRQVPTVEPEQDRPRSQSLPHVERELREYTQNFENGRALRDSQMREHEAFQKSSRDNEDRKIVYVPQDIYQRPVDEVDTPRFPTDVEGRTGRIFPKMVNPGVKIMKVEHDVEDAIDGYRYSDTSQYDNVPIRMRGSSPGILKKSRDVSFNVPPPPKNSRKAEEAVRDEIEMLEECFGVLRTTSTGTQTHRTPSTPTDPGFVKHAASKWPYNAKSAP